MPKSNRKSAQPELPMPIKVKKEKKEEDRALQPMSHYVDDRLELVNQIFGTLKPKTIINLAPGFLKSKDLVEIQSLCLNELLGISTKRLTSVINAVKCPTDTESSEDSDIQHKEAHISLEEISSDSELEGSKRKAKKKKKISSNPSTSKKSAEIKLTNEKKEPEEAISVLELLELQARARAIRSQLAMEPITKIEVNSDNEGNEVITKSNGVKKSPVRSETANKIKKDIPSAVAIKSRSTSPEVIPIPVEQETLSISDSSEDERVNSNEQKTSETGNDEPLIISDPEEGELSDKDCQQQPLIKVEAAGPSKILKEAVKGSNATAKVISKEPQIDSIINTNSIELKGPKDMALNSSLNCHENSPKTPINVTNMEDDVISIEGGDLEQEMNEHLAEAIEREKTPKSIEPREVSDDIIHLNTSDDDACKEDEEINESWHSRYVKSNKVSQVLAASRLGKRVRDKIKQTKHEEKNKNKEIEDTPVQPAFSSKHEDGSIEQYKELIELEQKKKKDT